MSSIKKTKKDASQSAEKYLSSSLNHKDFLAALPTISSNILSRFEIRFKNLDWQQKKKAILKFNPSLSCERISYNEIPGFIDSSEEEKELYVSTSPITKYVGDEYKQFSGEVDFSTHLCGTFCEILQENFNSNSDIRFIDPVIWNANVFNATFDFSFKHPICKDDTKQIHTCVCDDNHFFSIHVEVKDHAIYILDSFYSDDEPKDPCSVHVYFLLHHLKSQFTDPISWKVNYVHDNPKQENCCDCGVYTLKNMEYWARRIRLPFAGKAMRAREIILSEITEKKLKHGA